MIIASQLVLKPGIFLLGLKCKFWDDFTQLPTLITKSPEGLNTSKIGKICDRECALSSGDYISALR